MSISKRWVSQKKNVSQVLTLYRGRDAPTIHSIAQTLGTTYHNVGHVLKAHMPPEERSALAKVRYSASKTGTKNPMKGKTGKDHHNWVGECEDGYGYLTCLHRGKRVFVHRVVMAEALKVETLPENMMVHHIDNDPKNNKLDNLALTTKVGHKTIHYLQATDSIELKLRKSSIADALKYMT